MASLLIHEEISAQFPGLNTFLAKYQDGTFVVKYGGNAMIDASLKKALAKDIVLLSALGIRMVVLHGGGPQIESALGRLGLQGKFIKGLRVTDEVTLQVAQWVLTGQVQQEIVREINAAGGKAVGLCGLDGNLLQATKLQMADNEHPGKWVDLGFVGEIIKVNTEVLTTLLDAGFIPVISPIASGQEQTDLSGQNFNINADSAAAAVAKALQADQLLMLTNIAGVLDKSGQLVRELNSEKIATMIEDGTISGGMIPKIQGALEASCSGVENVYIMDGRVEHVLSQGLLAGVACGTLIAQ